MKLLLVDDESFVCERIRRQIDWDQLGIDEMTSCCDGLQALNIIRTLRPDILVTDIRMPNLDGIKLAEEFLYQFPEARVIFISGYSDVPYLRSAIRLRAVSYVEKPIDMEELAADIRTAAEEIRNLHQVQIDRELLMSQGKLARKNAVARGLVHEETCGEAAQLLREMLNGRPACLFASCITQLYRSETAEALGEEDLCLQAISAFQAAEMDACAFLDGERLVIQLICFDEQQTKTASLSPVFRSLTSFLSGRNIRCGHSVGRFVRNPDQLPLSYQSAMKNLPRIFYKGPGCLLTDRGETPRSMDMSALSLSAYAHALKKDNSEMIVSLLENLAEQLRFHDATLPPEALRFYYAVLMRMFRDAEKENILLFEEPMDEYRMLDRLQRFPFLDDLQGYTLSVVRDYYEKVHNHYTDNPVVNKIIGYVQQSYADPDLSVTKIAEHMKLSSTYVCHLFRSVTDETLGDYLTRLRLEKAQELLETGRYQVREIARMVGYRNGNYFSYRFRKQMGYAPSDRREDRL